MNLEACGITDVGCVRSNNEDNFVCDTQNGLFAVCDGMGGHAAGEVASAMACKIIAEQAQALRRTHLGPGCMFTPHLAEHLTQLMGQAAADLSRTIAEAGQSKSGQRGMGTTCTVLWFIGDDHALVVHIGDSRLYLQSKVGSGIVTQDHTLVEELVARGLISAVEAKRHPQSHILSRALGASTGSEADCFVIRVFKNDRFLLCSDGLHAYLPDNLELGNTLSAQDAPDSVEHLLGALIDNAKKQGGHDNLTGVLVHIAPEPSAPGQSASWSEPDYGLLECMGAHPALKHLPDLLLRRLAAQTIILDIKAQPAPRHSLPHSGILWLMHGAVGITDAAGVCTQLAPSGYWSPCALGASTQDVAYLSPSQDCRLVYLAAEALQNACDTHPALGASVLHGLLTYDDARS